MAVNRTDWQHYGLSPAAGGIDTVYEVLVPKMQAAGWHDARYQTTVYGSKPGTDLITAVLFLPIVENQTFWQVISSGGSASEAEANQQIADLKAIIAGLAFL
jgi:hypothetical protein